MNFPGPWCSVVHPLLNIEHVSITGAMLFDLVIPLFEVGHNPIAKDRRACVSETTAEKAVDGVVRLGIFQQQQGVDQYQEV